jgi:gamma-glutamyltranspeptidase
MFTPTFATRGMVASPHALASGAGADALRAGGSAVDAAIAAAAALGVVYPHMCGIGGDAFWLIYDAAARKVSYLDGGGRAAAAATLEHFRGQQEIPFRGLVSATLSARATRNAAAGALPAGRHPVRARWLPGHSTPFALDRADCGRTR